MKRKSCLVPKFVYFYFQLVSFDFSGNTKNVERYFISASYYIQGYAYIPLREGKLEGEINETLESQSP